MRGFTTIFIMLVLCLNTVALAGASTDTATTTPATTECPEGTLVVNSSGTYICIPGLPTQRFQHAVVSAVFANYVLNISLTCLEQGGCTFHVVIYYIDNSTGSLTTYTTIDYTGQSYTYSYNLYGKPLAGDVVILDVTVNDYYYGKFYVRMEKYNVSGDLVTVVNTLTEKGGALVSVILLSIPVAVPLGYALMTGRRGVAGLTMMALALFLPQLTTLLTGNVSYAILVAVITFVLGLLIVIQERGRG